MTGCFIIKWKSIEPVSAPLAELIIGYGGSGYSYVFVFKGVIVEDEGG